MLFSVFITDLDDGTEYTHSKFRDATKLERAVDSRAVIQRDLDRLENCAERNLTKFINRKKSGTWGGVTPRSTSHWG